MRLAPGYASCSDAADGPLRPGDVGVLKRDDGSSKPFHVEAAGKTWWYDEAAVETADGSVPAPGEVVTRANHQLGRKVRRGPNWKWDDQDSRGPGTLGPLDSDSWAKVDWDAGGSNSYRVGADGQHDLVYVDGSAPAAVAAPVCRHC